MADDGIGLEEADPPDRQHPPLGVKAAPKCRSALSPIRQYAWVRTVLDDSDPPPVASRLAAAIAAFVATPFVITLLYRLLPTATPTWMPFAVVALALGIAWIAQRRWRAVVVGGAAGWVAWGLFLAWLLSGPILPE